MPDGDGHILKAGAPVADERPEGEVTATVLAVRSDHCYLIQLGPVQPRSRRKDPRLKMVLDAEAALLLKLAANRADVQEPIETDGSNPFVLEAELG